jgi:hypothetical protein
MSGICMFLAVFSHSLINSPFGYIYSSVAAGISGSFYVFHGSCKSPAVRYVRTYAMSYERPEYPRFLQRQPNDCLCSICHPCIADLYAACRTVRPVTRSRWERLSIPYEISHLSIFHVTSVFVKGLSARPITSPSPMSRDFIKPTLSQKLPFLTVLLLNSKRRN